MVAAKEKSIDSLRDQLSSLKRMLEGRAQQAEDQVIQKDLEVGFCTCPRGRYNPVHVGP